MKEFTSDLTHKFVELWSGIGKVEEIDEIATSKYIEGEDGVPVPLTEQINVRYGHFLYCLVLLLQPRRILEVGMANGVSSAYIAMAQRSYHDQNCVHYIIDPFQTSDWNNMGEMLLKRLGFASNTKLFEEMSIHTMSDLDRNGEKFDFVFIDGNHCMDYTLSDVLLADRLLVENGLIALDDSTDFGVNLAIPYLDKYRNNLQRIRFDGPLVHWIREKISGRRRLTVYRKLSEDKRGASSK